MKLSMEEAAQVIGKTKKTIYNHKDKNRFTYEIDSEGKAVVDASELIRVYGSSSEINERLQDLEALQRGEVSVKKDNYTTSNKASKKEESLITEYKIRLAKLEAELSKEQELKKKSEEQVDYFKEALDKAQETSQKITLLLENKSQETNREEKWQSAMSSIETRVANQEIKTQEEKERAQKILRQNQALKKALDAEKNKSFFQKLFG
jgi:hypothetical protein